MKEVGKKVVVLAKKNDAICVKVERLTDIGGKLYNSANNTKRRI
ncbi:hypothetical protein [Vallitalea guaymasensis]|nr:hypothetical protein [Vallitalea guaymasensis]